MSTFTITFSWWVLPWAITAVAAIFYFLLADHRPATGYGSLGKGVVNLVLATSLTVIVLVAWLVWAVFAK